MGPGSIFGEWACFLEPNPYAEMPCSALIQVEGTWSGLNLKWQILLTPNGRL